MTAGDSILEIEERAHSLQVEIYRTIWKGHRPQDLTEVFEPGIALDYLGYSVQSVEEIGRFWVNGNKHEIAGVIEQEQKAVTIAERNFSYLSKRFTAAHELAHSVLHPDMRTLHRDIPLERTGVVQDWREAQANRFASAYLMPRKLVEDQFRDSFGMETFELTDTTAFALCGTCDEKVHRFYRDQRQLSLCIATTQRFNGCYFQPLSEFFRVSPLAMAIRLEQLELVRCSN